MKFVCQCKELVEDTEVVIVIQGRYTFVYCEKCYKEKVK